MLFVAVYRASLILLPHIRFSLVAIVWNAKHHINWRTWQNQVLGAHRLTLGSQGLWGKVKAKITVCQQWINNKNSQHHCCALDQNTVEVVIYHFHFPVKDLSVWMHCRNKHHRHQPQTSSNKILQRVFQVKWMDEENWCLTQEEGGEVSLNKWHYNTFAETHI